MKNYRIFNNAKVVMAALAMGAMATACSDWDDHYEANSSVTGSSSATLWENISANANLSEFAQLAKKTGYDKVLQSSQTFTVWAPLNGTFDFETLNNSDVTDLTNEFMRNHVARFSYPASGPVNERVFMLNEKMNIFQGNGTYQMGDVKLQDINIASSNGTMHTLDGKLDFNYNIFESLNTKTYALDSITEYFKHFNQEKLDLDASVKGPVVDGEITYLDSVKVEYNQLCNLINAHIDREDSTYTMIVPTNEAWNKAMATLDNYYKYIPSYQYFKEFPQTLKGADASQVDYDLIDDVYLADSLKKLFLVADLAFNNKYYGNVKLPGLQHGESLQTDSLVSTVYDILYTEDAKRLFDGTIAKEEKSNGYLWIADSLHVRPWNSWKPEVIVQGEMTSRVAGTFNGTVSRVNVNSINKNQNVEGKLSNNAYAEVRQTSSSGNPEVDFYLPGVRAGKYMLYVSIVPANIDSTMYVTSVLPNRLQVKCGYHNEKGKYAEKSFPGYFENDVTKVDEVKIGEIEFPVSTAGLDNAMPYVRLLSRVTSNISDKYDRTIRIDYIRLVPIELYDYLQENPDYKYYQSLY